jgi:hypothetical protein
MGIDRADEAFWIGYNDFEKYVKELEHLMFLLLNCRIVCKYCGSKYTKIYFYHGEECVDTHTDIELFYLFRSRGTTKEYLPISSVV